jgi:hypothetical protein
MGLCGINVGDLVILSDIDEIPNAQFVSSLTKALENQFYIAKMNLFRYCHHFISSETWHGSIGFRYDGSQLDFQRLRMQSVRHWQENECIVIDDAGVHCSSFLSTSELKEKIQSFSHTELNVFPWNNSLFLFLLKNLGVSIDGKEVLKLSRSHDQIYIENICSKKHQADKMRIFAAKRLAKITEYAFDIFVSKLSAPDQE